jgi:hypothetical protein
MEARAEEAEAQCERLEYQLAQSNGNVTRAVEVGLGALAGQAVAERDAALLTEALIGPELDQMNGDTHDD